MHPTSNWIKLAFACVLVWLVPWLVPTSASGQSVAYVLTRASAEGCLPVPREPFTTACFRTFISIVNTDTRQVDGTIELWKGSGASGRVDLTVRADGRRLYVTVPLASSFGTIGGTAMWVFDTATRQRITTIDLGTGYDARCAWAADARHFICSQKGLFGDISVIDTATNTVQRFPSSYLWPDDVAATPDGLYVYLLRGQQLVVLDASTYQQVTTVQLPSAGGGIEITPDGSRAYVWLFNSLAEIDTARHLLVAEIPVEGAGAIAFARGRAYVSTFTGPRDIQVIDLSTRTTSTSIPTPATALFASADEARLYVSVGTFLRVIDTGLNHVVADIPLDGVAGLFALTPPTPAAMITVDVPSENAVVSQPFEFGGWAAHVRLFGGGPGVSAVHVWAYPASGGAPIFIGSNYGRPRSDVASLFGSSYLNSGYQITVRGLPAGDYTLRASAFDLRTGGFSLAAERRVTVAGGTAFGVIDTPLPGTLVAGTVLVTGWALSSDGVARVAIYRDPMVGETAQVWIGDATFVEGARPDVAAAFPGYPQNGRAGWGLAVLSNMLPNRGDGPMTFHAVAYDTNNNTTTLGSRTVTGTNHSSVQPFGTIDTPGQGETVSGVIRNWGWALTPSPGVIPFDGSTIGVFIDGVFVGRPVYGLNRPDIAALFPGYANTNAAVGYFDFDTRTLADGVHTISWVVYDNLGAGQGIGSRYFTVHNQ